MEDFKQSVQGKEFSFQIEVEPDYECYYLTESVYKNITVPSNCSSISFLNVGDVAVAVKLIPLKVNAPMLSFNNEPSVMDRTFYEIVFDAQTLGTKPNVLIIRRHLSKAQKVK